MKYLKLFEQVDEWDDPFGEDYVPSLEDMIMRPVRYADTHDFYLIEKILGENDITPADPENGRCILYRNFLYGYGSNRFHIDEMDEDDSICYFDHNGKHIRCDFEKLPQEIKDKIK